MSSAKLTAPCYLTNVAASGVALGMAASAPARRRSGKDS